MKFCKDCEHMGFIWCHRPIPMKLNLVTGEDTRPLDGRLSSERKPRGLIFNRDRCGPDAIHFTPRTTTPTPHEEQREIYERNRGTFNDPQYFKEH